MYEETIMKLMKQKFGETFGEPGAIVRWLRDEGGHLWATNLAHGQWGACPAETFFEAFVEYDVPYFDDEVGAAWQPASGEDVQAAYARYCQDWELDERPVSKWTLKKWGYS